MTLGKTTIALLSLFSVPAIANAQIVPDQSLPTNSIITPGCINCVIEGGTRIDSNLFHSFKEFSVPTGSSASFNNTTEIRNIFTRVTGSSISSIDGLLRTNGSANFFFINPNGILFGPDARLEIDGSVIFSTADRIWFQDGQFYSASQTEPLLTNKLPSALEFLDNGGSVNVKGRPHQVKFIAEPGSGLSESLSISSEQTDGLIVIGTTLALIGGSVNFDGGAAIAYSGNMEVAGVQSGIVKLQAESGGFAFNYDGVVQRGNISLKNQALLDASSSVNGRLQVFGNQVSISESSFLYVYSVDNPSPGGIRINAADLSLSGLGAYNAGSLTPSQQPARSIITEGVGNSFAGPNIEIIANTVRLSDGAQISAISNGEVQSGNISLFIKDLVVGSASPIDPYQVSSTITTLSYASGEAGDIHFEGHNVSLENGGTLLSVSYSSGSAGDLTVKAGETITVSGGLPVWVFNVPRAVEATASFSYSSIGSQYAGFNPEASSGSIKISAKRLEVLDGAQVGTNAFFGSGGDLSINVQELEIRGVYYPSIEGYSSFLGKVQETEQGRRLLDNFPEIFDSPKADPPFFATVGSGAINFTAYLTSVTGEAEVQARPGSTRIQTENLVMEEGRLGGPNTGFGAGGNLLLTTKTADIKQSAITAQTEFGNGGNVNFTATEYLRLTNSQIVALASQDGDGGNLVVTSPLIFGNLNQFVADASRGRGGGIVVNADYIFLPNTVFSASSGLDASFGGRIEVRSNNQNTADFNVEPVTFTQGEITVASPCQEPTGNTLSRSGGAGQLASPTDLLSPGLRGGEGSSVVMVDGRPFVEAQSIVKLPNGKVSFVARSSRSSQEGLPENELCESNS